MNPDLPAYLPDEVRLKRLEPSANRPAVTVDKPAVMRMRVGIAKSKPKARKGKMRDPRNVKFY